MDFSQLAAAAASAAAGGTNLSSITNAFLSTLANNTSTLNALQAVAAAQLPQHQQQHSSRQNLQQAHHHSSRSVSSASSNQNSSHPISSVSNLTASAALQAAAAAAAAQAGLPMTNLQNQLAAAAAAAAASSGQLQPPHHQQHQKLAHKPNHAPLLASYQQQLQKKQQQHHHQSSTSNANLVVNNSQAHMNSVSTTNATNSVKSSTYYRIGDCVYFETSPPMPLQIGRIDELSKTNGDNIEVKAVCFFRRRDISSSLMHLADKYQYDESQEEEIKNMSEKDKHLLKQRELFYSRQIETLPASSIRGKCTVQLLNESESLASYINKEDHFFYTLVYDPQQKTMLADRGEIRVGQRYQAEVTQGPVYVPQAGGDLADPRDMTRLETLVYSPDHKLTDDEINKFLTISKSVGTFARALDCSSSIKQPSLHLTAASASRDVTLLYAMQLLHQHNYDLGKAVCALVPSTGPVLCRDEIEEWTAGEATLFEEAIEKYGREFVAIRQDFIPWKSVKNIVEYYYMWKTTDRCINQRRMKVLEAESKVKQVCIPNNKKYSSTNGVSDGHNLASFGRPCEGCSATSSSQWHTWQVSNVQRRLCNECWIYWKKYGGLRFIDRSKENNNNNDSKASPQPNNLSLNASTSEMNLSTSATKQSDNENDQEGSECSKLLSKSERLQAHLNHPAQKALLNLCEKFRSDKNIYPGSPSPKPVLRDTILMIASKLAKSSRKLLPDLVKKKHARNPCAMSIDTEAVREECIKLFANGSSPSLKKCSPKLNKSIDDVSKKYGLDHAPVPEWLKIPQSDKTDELDVNRSSNSTSANNRLGLINKTARLTTDGEIQGTTDSILGTSSAKVNSVGDQVKNRTLKRTHDGDNSLLSSSRVTIKRRNMFSPKIKTERAYFAGGSKGSKTAQVEEVYFFATKEHKTAMKRSVNKDELKRLGRRPFERPLWLKA